MKNFTKTLQIRNKFQNKVFCLQQRISKSPQHLLLFLLARFRVIRYLHSIFSGLFFDYSEVVNLESQSCFSDLDVNEIVKVLRKDGIFEGIFLSANVLKNIVQFTNFQNCFPDGKVNMGFNISQKDKVDKAYGQPFYVARYFNVSTSCTAISKLAKDPILKELATKYIGKGAKYSGSSLYWTFPLKDDLKPYDFSRFHYDLEDYASLRFCFYINDVTSESGPHICISGSHKRKPILSILNYFTRTYPENKLINFYGQEQFINLIGEAGYGFIEDVFCFHRGDIPKSQPRLFLQLHFVTRHHVEKEFHDYRAPQTLKSFNQNFEGVI